MKRQLIKCLTIASTLISSPTIIAQEENTMQQTASFIQMKAKSGQETQFAEFLVGAAPIVKETEPGTTLWFALKGATSTLAIFDIFKDTLARDAHFSGAVAGALNDNAERLVEGGWNNGVIPNMLNSSVLSENRVNDLYSAKTATYIKLKAAPGQSQAVEDLLRAAGQLVERTEPKTLYWVALKLDENNFGIFDIFADESGREAHFAGQVAALLKEKSSEIIDGGWDAGVVANVNNFDILAIK